MENGKSHSLPRDEGKRKPACSIWGKRKRSLKKRGGLKRGGRRKGGGAAPQGEAACAFRRKKGERLRREEEKSRVCGIVRSASPKGGIGEGKSPP